MKLDKTSIALFAAMSLLYSTLFVGVAEARFAPKSSFTHCVADQHIFCEPGSQSLAELISPSLKNQISQIEAAQSDRFDRPVAIYTYSTRESFVHFSGAAGYADAATSHGAINVSPKLLTTPERAQGVIAHELSHLQLLLRLGSWSMASLPAWFTEGLATFVSRGGGAETVSDEQAIAALRSGQRFTPIASQFPFRPRYGDSYGLAPHMFYRQSALFVAFLHDNDPAAFASCMSSIEQKSGLSSAISNSYRRSLDDLWREFLHGKVGALP